MSSIIEGKDDSLQSTFCAFLLYQGRFMPHPGLERRPNSSLGRQTPFVSVYAFQANASQTQLAKITIKKNCEYGKFTSH